MWSCRDSTSAPSEQSTNPRKCSCISILHLWRTQNVICSDLKLWASSTMRVKKNICLHLSDDFFHHHSRSYLYELVLGVMTCERSWFLLNHTKWRISLGKEAARFQEVPTVAWALILTVSSKDKALAFPETSWFQQWRWHIPSFILRFSCELCLFVQQQSRYIWTVIDLPRFHTLLMLSSVFEECFTISISTISLRIRHTEVLQMRKCSAKRKGGLMAK